MATPTAKQQRQIFDGPVRHQHAPFFEVKTKGTSIEYTDKFGEAYDAYREAGLPKEIVKITVVAGRGFRKVIESTSAIRHLNAAEANARGLNVVQVSQ